MAALPRIPRPPAELFGDDIAPQGSVPGPDGPVADRSPGVADLLAWLPAGIADLRLVGAAVLGVAVIAAVGWSLLSGGGVPAEGRLPVATTTLPGTAAPVAASAGVAGAEPAPRAQSGTAGASGSDALDGGPDEVVVHVAGAVLVPGLHRLGSPARVQDAVAAAGGLAPDADGDRLNLAAPVDDGARVYVPRLGVEVPSVDPSTLGGSGGTTSGVPGPGSTDAEPVDLNAASATELEALPGVGPATAAAIVEHRERVGPFGTVDALLDVRGIGEAKLEAVRDLVVVR